jgi:hypothetical protein
VRLNDSGWSYEGDAQQGEKELAGLEKESLRCQKGAAMTKRWKSWRRSACIHRFICFLCPSFVFYCSNHPTTNPVCHPPFITNDTRTTKFPLTFSLYHFLITEQLHRCPRKQHATTLHFFQPSEHRIFLTRRRPIISPYFHPHTSRIAWRSRWLPAANLPSTFKEL